MALQLLKELASTMTRWPATRTVLKDQLERAAISVVLNLSEGAGKITPKDRSKYFAISRDSIQEVAGCLDVVHALGHLSHAENHRYQSVCLSIVKMVSKLISVQASRQLP